MAPLIHDRFQRPFPAGHYLRVISLSIFPMTLLNALYGYIEHYRFKNAGSNMLFGLVGAKCSLAGA